MPGERDRIDGHDLLDSLSDALFAVDSDRRLSYANRRLLEVLDVPREALLSEPLAALEPFIDRGFDDLGSAVDDVRSGAGERRVEIEATLPDAAPLPRHLPVDARVTPLAVDGLAGALAVLRNVSEYRRRRAELREEAERFRAMFQRHSAPVLLIDPDSGRIEEANQSAVEFYGYDADRLDGMSIQEINCRDPEAIERERERARSGDRNCFLFELLENAVVHNDRETPRVEVETALPEGNAKRVRLSVSDNGPGIAPQERTAVEIDVEDPLEHGSGIGLSHIHWVVTDYGGEVEISDNDPRGTVVSLSLPRAEPPDAPE